MKKPIVGITIGDGAGIGMEIILKMLKYENVLDICVPVIIGDKRIVDFNLKMLNIELKYKILDGFDANLKENNLYIYDLKNLSPDDIEFGKISAKTGKASGEYIETAINLALNKRINAIVTAPINKESFKLGGYGDKFVGHTEMLASLTNTTDFSMMLAHGNIRILHVSTHVSLINAIKVFVKKENIYKKIKLSHKICKNLGIERPKIAVAGLNPHSSEGGLFGNEEEKEILPAIQQARKEGINVEGAIPPDTVFVKAIGGEYDIVVAMYHDQGHIPVKVAGFEFDAKTKKWNLQGVNVTVGLPIIRTSPDHGTAFGKAGKGVANHKSMYDALLYAVKLSKGSL